MTRKSLIRDLFGDRATLLKGFIGKNKNRGICKHKHFLYETLSGLICVKEFNNSKAALSESKAYIFFTSNGLLQVPPHYYSDEIYLVTGYIQSKDISLTKIISDWSKVHLNTINQTLFEEIDPIQNTLENISHHKVLFGDKSSLIQERLLKGAQSPIKSITHGDLYSNNIISTTEGNYYIDFESIGVSHPARDLSLLLFNANENERQSIISEYLYSIRDLCLPNFEEDILTFWIERLSRIVIGLHQESYLPQKFRNYYLERAYSQLDFILN